MKLSGISKIDDTAGDYLVLTDFGMEGIVISHQCETAAEAAQWMISSHYSAPHAVVKLVSVEVIAPDITGEHHTFADE